jgi:spermidine synthase
MNTTLYETSDPNNPIQYTGILLASNTNPFQSWNLLDTKEYGQMLFINNQHQSSSQDEHIYHETFVHSLFLGLSSPKKVLVLGGAEGCMAREVLRWKSVQRIVQVDWDASLLEYFKTKGSSWNGGVYNDPRLEVILENAITWIQSTNEKFDAIFIDLFDPSYDDLSILEPFLLECKQILAPNGGISINAGSISKINKTPACSLATFLRSTFVEPAYHRVALKVDVPSFQGTWCFLQIVPKLWSYRIHDNAYPIGLHHFTKNVLIQSTTWSSEYPSELQDYWICNSNKQIVCKKLTPYFDSVSNRLYSDFYGC